MPDGKIAQWAVEQMVKEHRKPFFLAMGFYKPHIPWFAPQKYFDLYAGEAPARPPTIAGDLDDLAQTGRDYALLAHTGGTHRTVNAARQWRAGVTGFLACVSFVDAQIGRVLDALERSPYAENTLIVFWSDHGVHLGEKEHWGKYTPWERSTRVPLIVSLPKSATPNGTNVRGVRCDHPVSLLDFYPTLIEVCGLPPKSGLDGRSFYPMMLNPNAEVAQAAVTTIGRGTHSIRYREWEYIHYFDGTEELYNLRNDPHEWENVANLKEHAGIKEACARHLPRDSDISRYCRYGRWKAVVLRTGDIQLYDLYASKDEEAGIAEHTDVAKAHADVVATIRELLATQPPDQVFLDLGKP
jgi:arylsulfatase A-like enzyme